MLKVYTPARGSYRLLSRIFVTFSHASSQVLLYCIWCTLETAQVFRSLKVPGALTSAGTIFCSSHMHRPTKTHGRSMSQQKPKIKRRRANSLPDVFRSPEDSQETRRPRSAHIVFVVEIYNKDDMRFYFEEIQHKELTECTIPINLRAETCVPIIDTCRLRH